MSARTPEEWAVIDAEQLRIVDAIFAPENFAKLGTFAERASWNRAHLAPSPGGLNWVPARGWDGMR